MKKKYQLPLVACLNQIQINIKHLQSNADLLLDKFIDVCSANPSLCENHAELVSQVYDNFAQINLTTNNGVTLPYTASIKERLRRKEERLYNIPTKEFIGSYFQRVIQQFKSPAMRVRITKLVPGKSIPLHIDYSPTYATRIVIPIYSNQEVKNIFKVNNKVHEFFLEPGKVYFVNTGFQHGVLNESDQDRIALMFSLDGQEDLVAL